MATKDAIEYLKQNSGKFSQEQLLMQLRNAGYPEAELQEAVSLLHGVHQNYGGFFRRLFAFSIDILLIYFSVALVFQLFLRSVLDFALEGQGFGALIIILLMQISLIFLFLWLYTTLLESSSYQATLGKMIFHLKVTDYNGQRISWGCANIRHFSKFISMLILGIGFIMVAFTSRKQGLHDRIAHTLVIKSR